MAYGSSPVSFSNDEVPIVREVPHSAPGWRRLFLPSSQGTRMIGDHTVPPWMKYPRTPPSWGGWRQGTSERWLSDWLFFWRRLSPEARTVYLDIWPPPDDSWRAQLVEWAKREVR
jgi:hypothetical protein